MNIMEEEYLPVMQKEYTFMKKEVMGMDITKIEVTDTNIT
jgi:hypothetical protein